MQDIIQAIKNLKTRHDVKMEDIGKLTTIVTAELLALKLNIPSSEVEDTRSYFRAQHEVSLNQKLAKINEYTIINIDVAIKLTYDIWTARYELVHRPNNTRVGRLLAHVVSTDNSIISKDYLDVINAYPKAYLARHEIKTLDTDQ